MRYALVALPLLLTTPAIAGGFVYAPVHVAPVVHVTPMIHTTPVIRTAPAVHAEPAVGASAVGASAIKPSVTTAAPAHVHPHHAPIVVPVTLSTVQAKPKCAQPKPGDKACAKN